jgi:hypothetical protein
MFWGDHRTLAQHAAHDAVEVKRWRLRVERNQARRQALAAATARATRPVYVRMGAL